MANETDDEKFYQLRKEGKLYIHSVFNFGPNNPDIRNIVKYLKGLKIMFWVKSKMRFV